MNVAEKLSGIRKQMSECLAQKPKNIAEYKRLAAEHRRILHTANPAIEAQWKACHDRSAVR
jgi:hypothetical protein